MSHTNLQKNNFTSSEPTNINELNLVRLLKKKGLKISFAESCTGGLISKKITDIPGASEVFECAVCAYSNNIKNKILHVENQILKEYSAVSEQTAIAMAEGVRDICKSDIAISVTGFAGPNYSGCSDPVGLVYIGISSEIYTGAKKFNFIAQTENERDSIREQAAFYALALAQKIARLSRCKTNFIENKIAN